MTPKQIALVQQSFRIIDTKTEQIGDAFYTHLFTLNPNLRQLFDTDMAGMKRKFLELLSTLIGDLEMSQRMQPAIVQLGQRHVDYGVHAEDYRTGGEALLAALAEVLGDQWTVEMADAWRSVYGHIEKTILDSSYSS